MWIQSGLTKRGRGFDGQRESKVHITESGKSVELVVLREAAERIELVDGEGAHSGSVNSPRRVMAYLRGRGDGAGNHLRAQSRPKFELILTGSTRPCVYRDSIDCDSCSQATRCYRTWVASLPGSARPQRDVPRIRVFAMGRLLADTGGSPNVRIRSSRPTAQGARFRLRDGPLPANSSRSSVAEQGDLSDSITPDTGRSRWREHLRQFGRCRQSQVEP